VTPEERLIAALKTQKKIVFGNTIGVDGNGECTVVGEDATVRAIAGTPISAGSCVALQTDDGQWYAVSARESGTVQKRTLYKRKNKPPASDEEGGPVKILYIKESVFYVGGDRSEPTEVYRLPSNYELFGLVSINNLGTGLNDWIVNIRLKKADKITLISVTSETENRVEDIDIPKVYGGFGGTDPSSFFRCFQNGFYTAFGHALKRRNNSLGFLEAVQIKYVTYYGNTLTSTAGNLDYSDTQTIGIQSASFSLSAISPIVGDSITVTITTYAIAPDGTLETTPHSCTYTITSDDRSEIAVATELVEVLSSVFSFTLPDFGFYADTNTSPSRIVIRGTYTSDQFTFTTFSDSPRIILGDNTEISPAIKPVDQSIRTFYAEDQNQTVKVVFGYNSLEDGYYVGTDLEYTIAIGAKQESVIFIKKIGDQHKTLLIEGNNIREFPRAKFKNPLDSDNDLTDILKYFRPNLVGQTLFNVPLQALTKQDPKTEQQIPIDSLDVFITDLSRSDPKTTKQTVSITQPDTSYVALDVSAYIA